MSCPDGSCLEPMKRRRALILLGLMMLIFIMLSAFSFLDSRGQVTPDQVSFASFQATDGKRVFQAYNCMGCHTIVGNGAYFAPDLTKEYNAAGPAWLAAFLPSAGSWPTEAAIKTQLMNSDIAADAGVSTIEEYYKKFPGAKERVERRGGQTTFMPNLPFRSEEVGQLIAFLKYTSEMDTEGWPPEIKVEELDKRINEFHGKTAMVPSVPVGTEGAQDAANLDPAAQGEALAKSTGCIACHSPGGEKLVGPAWGGLYNSEVLLADGTKVVADEAYLIESIKDPGAKVVEGFAPVMPPYAQILSDAEIEAIVKYIETCKN